MFQTTLAHEFTCTGIGLHSGSPVSVTCAPAPADTGIIFNTHSEHGDARISLNPSSVMATALATTIGTKEGSVSTVEHLLAALRGMGVDNCIVTADSEIPILDGSAAIFADKIDEVGLDYYDVHRRVLRITRPVEMSDGNKSIQAYPVNTPGAFRINYYIDFPHPAIRQQSLSIEVTTHKFFRVANARTFGFLRDVEYMHRNGLARGGSMDNAIVLDNEKVLNPEGLRYPDEFVRHKILDFIGDMAMARLPLQGNFTVSCSGHQFNNAFLRKLEAEGALEEIVLDTPLRPAMPKFGRRSKPAFNCGIAASTAMA